ncbi:hypothetical protein pb186bvf_004570 [Paramecium bursaria]
MIKLDSDFLKMQGYANKIFDSLPIVKEFKSEKDLINQLQFSCVCYGRKLVSLFDKYQVLLKKNQEGVQGVINNLAQVCNTQATEQAIHEFIKKQFKLIDQQQQKIEYLNQNESEDVYQKLLQHEQQLSAELQAVIDTLVKELKSQKDDKQMLLEQLKSQNTSPLRKSPISAQKNQNSDKSRVRFQNQLAQSLQLLARSSEEFCQNYTKNKTINIDYDQILVDDQQLQALNLSNVLRDINNNILDTEQRLMEYIQNQKSNYERQLLQEQTLRKDCLDELEHIQAKLVNHNETQNELQQSLGQLQQVQQFLQKQKQIKKRDVEQLISSDAPIFILQDDFLESEVQIQIEKHNSKIQQKSEDINSQIKQKQTLLDQSNQRLSRIRYTIEEGLQRSSIVLQELLRMADSNEAQKLLNLLRDEQKNMFQILQSIELSSISLESEIKQQRITWIQQIENLRKSFEEQTQRLAQELDLQNQKMLKFQEISEGLHQDNEQLVKKFRHSQQENIQLKEEANQLSGLNQDYERQYKQLKDALQMKEQEEKKVKQTQEETEKEVSRIKQELFNQKKNKQIEQQQEVQQLQDRISLLEFENNTYKKQIDGIEEEIRKNKQQRNQQDQVTEQEKQQLKKQIEEKKKQIITLQQENKQLNKEANNQIEDLSQELLNMSNKLEIKEEELRQLNKTLLDLEEFSRRQIEVIKSYEDKLTEAYQMKKSLESYQEGNDSLCGQLQIKVNQLASVNDRLQSDNDKLLNDLSMIQKQFSKQLSNKDEEYQDKQQKVLEINRILKEEAKHLKQQLEQRNIIIRQLEQDLRDKQMEIEKSNKSVRQLQSQMTDIQQRVDQFEDNKQDHQSTYDQMIQKIKQLSSENLQLHSELDKIHQNNNKFLRQNDQTDLALKTEIYNLKQELKKMESIVEHERLLSVKEINHYKLQLAEQPHKNTDQSLRQKSSQQLATGSAFYESLIEAKDLEISRLAGIVKTLTLK